MVILILMLLPLITALISPLMVRKIKHDGLGWILAVSPCAMLALVLGNSISIAHGNVCEFYLSWFQAFHVAFSFRLDGLSQLFIVLISGIGLPIVIYSKPYFEHRPYLGRYYALLFFFMLAMIGAVCADDLLTFFVFWEITSICSFLLIGLNHRIRKARKAAINALFITSIGSACLLLSFILLGQISASQSMTKIIAEFSLTENTPYFFWILNLLLLGVFTKSAQFPFSFWLPGAMHAPTPVSAYLHSATMVQLGIYLLARFHPLFAHSKYWLISLSTIGCLTMVSGAFSVMKQLDMKLMLAYTTIIALGSLVFSLASNDPMIIKACVSFLLVHALYKATLFMAVGGIQHTTGSRCITRISGLYKTMPITFLAVCVAGASMAGLPPLLGFYVKELVYEASLTTPMVSSIVTFIVVMANMVMACIAFILIKTPFWGDKHPLLVHEADINMSVNALFLAVITTSLSVFTDTIEHYLLSPAAEVILGRKVFIDLNASEGMHPSFVLSITTWTGALLLFFLRSRIRRWCKTLYAMPWIQPHYIMQTLLDLSVLLAQRWTTWWQRGVLSKNTAIVFCALFLIMLSAYPDLNVHRHDQGYYWFLSLIYVWLLVPAASLIFVKKFISGLILLGVFGFGLAVYFIFQGAPQLALSQILIETLIIVLTVFSLIRVKQWPDIYPESNWHRFTRAGIAIGIGIGTTLFLNTLLAEPFNHSMDRYFIENSLSMGHGRNVVNVILVNFRALDTFGESIVILISALGIYVLVRK